MKKSGLPLIGRLFWNPSDDGFWVCSYHKIRLNADSTLLQSIDRRTLKNNVVWLAKAAKVLNMPTTITSAGDGKILACAVVFGFSKSEFDIMLSALATLLVFQCLGEGVAYLMNIPVPGPVVGTLLLLGFVSLRPQSVSALEPTALEILKHLSLLFVPAGVGIMVSASSLAGDLVAVVASIAVSTTLTMAVTAVVMRAMLRRTNGGMKEPKERT